ncbi:tRNA(Ser) Um(44) 2'-O-methyltransferase [Collariella sp. IMI 366227]|nr:tRNA(Ser) Um(44) 2'-O-methyltransferase [Collariella sp. IMI 366227]
MKFQPEELAVDAVPLVIESSGGDEKRASWRPLFRHPCEFGPSVFNDVIVNLIQNPNINSSWLFRADILYDAAGPKTHLAAPPEVESIPNAPIPFFAGFELQRCIIRKLIPRNTLRDKPLDQTCLVYERVAARVRGIAFLHDWAAAESRGSISISYLFFNDDDRSVVKLTRTAFHLLEVIHKHGKGRLAGYQKRVHHDQILPQARVQNTYTRLKQKYARALIVDWAESTDPEKHVFEDLCIAAFLVELWADMYGTGPFPGFVDIGCGNGLLVYILNQEGFAGWGFDARSRKSWAAYNTKLQTPAGDQDTLRELVLLPPPVWSEALIEDRIHDGRFPKGTFIISNHADELTPWTPILAAISDCPWIAIPCCSHNLAGERYRAPAPKDKTKADSAYSSLVVWVAEIAKDCGWEVEQEMMRIPSTRNAALLGRKRFSPRPSPDIQAIVDRYGGTTGYLQSVIKLVTSTGSEH